MPRTLQMVDLVNTCSARVPHLLRLLPLPKFKSWVVAMISEDTPPQASKQTSGDGRQSDAARSDCHCPKPVCHWHLLPLPSGSYPWPFQGIGGRKTVEIHLFPALYAPWPTCPTPKQRCHPRRANVAVYIGFHLLIL